MGSRFVSPNMLPLYQSSPASVPIHSASNPSFKQHGREGAGRCAADNIGTSTLPSVTSNANCALLFAVPTLAILATIPAVLAFAHTPSTKGSPTSSEFYELLSSSIVQLLGLFIVLFPFLSPQSLDAGTKATTYIWFLGGISGLKTIGALPVFLVAAQNWASIMLFLGAAWRVLVVLQVVVGIVYRTADHCTQPLHDAYALGRFDPATPVQFDFHPPLHSQTPTTPARFRMADLGAPIRQFRQDHGHFSLPRKVSIPKFRRGRPVRIGFKIKVRQRDFFPRR